MARKSPLPVQIPPAPVAADDAVAALEDWLDGQRDWLGAQIDQWTRAQQTLLGTWFGVMDGFTTPWQAQMTGWLRSVDSQGKVFTSRWCVPDDPLRDATRLLEFWWSPWAPFVVRGGEQLA